MSGVGNTHTPHTQTHYTHTDTHTETHTQICTHTQTHRHAHTDTRARTPHTQTCTHTHTHTRTHTHTHRHVHTHTSRSATGTWFRRSRVFSVSLKVFRGRSGLWRWSPGARFWRSLRDTSRWSSSHIWQSQRDEEIINTLNRVRGKSGLKHSTEKIRETSFLIHFIISTICVFFHTDFGFLFLIIGTFLTSFSLLFSHSGAPYNWMFHVHYK